MQRVLAEAKSGGHVHHLTSIKQHLCGLGAIRFPVPKDYFSATSMIIISPQPLFPRCCHFPHNGECGGE
jgi:hypothetical protein